VPAGKTVRLYAVGTNLITSWTIADLGISVQTVPGRVQQTWFRTAREGRYLGVCLEVCALPRTFAPILLEVVSEERFARWVADARRRLASGAPGAPLHLASDTR
jgi:cytochrome c oxidase subunit 2